MGSLAPETDMIFGDGVEASLFEALIANAVFLCDADALLHWNSAAEEDSGGLKTGPPRRHQIQPVEGPVLIPVQRKRI